MCRKLGETVGLWVLTECGHHSRSEITAVAARSEFHQLLRRQLSLQEGEFFEDSPAYGEYTRALVNTVQTERETAELQPITHALQNVARLLDDPIGTDLQSQPAESVHSPSVVRNRILIEAALRRLGGYGIGAHPVFRLRLIVTYPETYGNLDPALESLVGRPADGGGSDGETRDLDWWFEPADIERAEEILCRLRADERFGARLVEVPDESDEV